MKAKIGIENGVIFDKKSNKLIGMASDMNFPVHLVPRTICVEGRRETIKYVYCAHVQASEDCEVAFFVFRAAQNDRNLPELVVYND